jgi:hypothetical protein
VMVVPIVVRVEEGHGGAGVVEGESDMV